jgi:hypothetical protein
MREAFKIAAAVCLLLILTGPIAQAMVPRVVVVEFIGAVY